MARPFATRKKIMASPPNLRSAARNRAQTHFKSSEQREDASRAEIAKERAAVDAKTARLKAQRLAKEAEEKVAADQVAAEEAEKKAAIAAKRAAQKVRATGS